MKNFLLLYRGDTERSMADMTPEEGAASMAAWDAWMTSAKDSIVDMGLPTATGQSLAPDGTTSPVKGINGYTIIKADDIDGAKEVVAGHPFIMDAANDFRIEIYECLPMPTM